LAGPGLEGKIIATPGHSDDHVTLILDDGSDFSGDLPPRHLAVDDVTRASGDQICQHKVTRIFPAHGNQSSHISTNHTPLTSKPN
jgi:ribonuclease/clavin/mitogillin